MILRPTAIELSPHRGKWVATKDGAVIMVSTECDNIIERLQQGNVEADSLFRVPFDPSVEKLIL